MQEVGAGRVYWITGLSGAGKTTLCHALVEALRAKGDNIVMLDGDMLREIFGVAGLELGRAEREKLALRYAALVKHLSEQGIDVAIATISMYQRVYDWNRAHLKNYHEIFIDVPIEELQRRDPKGIYKKADGQIMGIDIPVDLPPTPHLHLAWHPGLTAPENLRIILSYLGRTA